MAASLLALVQQRRSELESSLGPEAELTDEQRIRAYFMIAHRAELGDRDAQRRLSAIHELFRKAAPTREPDGPEAP